MKTLAALATLLFLLCLPVSGWANRVALVIGNSDYTSVVPLDNPRNDSAAVSLALRAQGFEVITGDNLGRVAMRDTLRRFRALADQAEIALVYYAGHGIEIAGKNYLIPVDARLEDERDAGLEMIDIDLVLRQISGARTLRMVVLDACRNNPFVIKMQRQGGSRSVGQGLGEIRSNQADTLISYAAAAGEITPDGRVGENSPFTAAFLAALSGPPMDVRRMLGQVRDRMRLSVPGAAPFVYSSLGGGEYIINPRSAGGSAPVPNTGDAAGTELGKSSISVDFVRIDRNGSVAAWDQFLIRYETLSTHPLYAFALEKRAALQGVTSTSRASTSTVFPNAPAGAAAAGTERPPAQDSPSFQSSGFVVVPTMTVEQAARSLQTELQDRACYHGRIDGLFGRNSKRGLAEFARQAGVPISLPPSPDASAFWAALELVGAFPDVICPQVVRRTTPSKPRRKTTKATPSAPAPAANTAPKKPEAKAPRVKPCPIQEILKFNRPECH